MLLLTATSPQRECFHSGESVSTQDIRILYLRAAPTAAGPSSSKRSILWRTRGFAALGFDCCVVAGAVSGMSGACLV